MLSDVIFSLRMDFIWAHEKVFTVGTVIVAAANKSEKP